MDPKYAYSKYYNPFTFDPDNASYQDDVRMLSPRVTQEDTSITQCMQRIFVKIVVDNYYTFMLRSEFFWPVVFGLGYAAMEPDVFSLFIH